MNIKLKVLFMLIVLALNIFLVLNLALSDENEVVEVLSIEISEINERWFTVQIKGTGHIQHKKAVTYKSPKSDLFALYIDMPNTRSRINKGKPFHMPVPAKPSSLSVDLPVVEISLAQFRLHPLISRVAFTLKKPVNPIIREKGNLLLVRFPLSTPPKKYLALKTDGLTIDGDLSDWADVPKLEIGGEAWEANGATWDNEADLSMSLMVMWNEDNLFIASKVKDEVHINTQTEVDAIWNGDSIQYMVDPTGNCTNTRGVVYEFGFALAGTNSDIPMSCRWLKNSAAPTDFESEFTIIRDEDAGTTIYEVRIPKEELAPAELKEGTDETDTGTGNTLGFGAIVNDGDSRAGRQKGWIGWGSHAIVYGKDATELQKIILSGKAPAIDAIHEEKPKLIPTAEKRPAVITQIKPIFESEVTKLCIISDKQLNFKQIMSVPTPTDTDIKAILELDLVNTTSDLPKEIPIPRKSFIRRVTLKTQKGPSPSCKIIIRLTKRVFYDINNVDGKLQVSFENPFLERIVSIRCDDESLSKLLLTLFRQYGVNIIVDKGVDVSQKVTFNLEDVPLKVALDEILGSLGYTYKEAGGGIVRVVSKEQLSEVSKKPVKPEKLETASFTLQYAPVSKLKEILQPLISENGKIISDERTNSIIIMDTPETITALSDRLDRIINKLDKKVSKKEKFIEPSAPSEKPSLIKRVIKLDYANPEELKKILSPLLSKEGKIEAVGKSISAGSSGMGGNSGMTEGGVSSSVGKGGYLIVNDTSKIVSKIEKKTIEFDLPIPQVTIEAYIIETILSDDLATGLDWALSYVKDETEISVNPLGKDKTAGGLSLKYGELSGKELTAVLQALSSKSNTEVLSQPKITVLENRQAKFHSGQQVGFSQVTVQQGVQTQETIFKDVGIVLTATPQVKENNMISLLIDIQVSSLGEATAAGEPTISNREVQTQVLVNNGDTVVIGGLSSDTVVKSVSKVPLLGDIPLLGRLFSWTQKNKDKTDVTIFITSRVAQTNRK